jgi:hypothetical protein
LRFQQKEIKRQKEVYFVFIMFCYVISIFVNPIPSMKKSLISLLSVCFFLCGMISVSGEDHKHELHKIGERIKQAVKAGKMTEKEGWAKWHAVQREHGHHDEEEGEDHEEDEWEEAEELEREIEILELEFELERIEREHDRARLEWDMDMERMKRDFDRERREWDMEHFHWDMRRKQMEMQMRGGMLRQGVRPSHPHGGSPKPDMHKGGPPRRMMPPMGRGPGQGQDRGSKVCPDSIEKSDCDKKKGKSKCGKGRAKSDCKKGKDACAKKECSKTSDCKKSESCSPKSSSSCGKDKKSCSDKKEDCSKKKKK